MSVLSEFQFSLLTNDCFLFFVCFLSPGSGEAGKDLHFGLGS